MPALTRDNDVHAGGGGAITAGALRWLPAGQHLHGNIAVASCSAPPPRAAACRAFHWQACHALHGASCSVSKAEDRLTTSGVVQVHVVRSPHLAWLMQACCQPSSFWRRQPSHLPCHGGCPREGGPVPVVLPLTPHARLRRLRLRAAGAAPAAPGLRTTASQGTARRARRRRRCRCCRCAGGKPGPAGAHCPRGGRSGCWQQAGLACQTQQPVAHVDAKAVRWVEVQVTAPAAQHTTEDGRPEAPPHGSIGACLAGVGHSVPPAGCIGHLGVRGCRLRGAWGHLDWRPAGLAIHEPQVPGRTGTCMVQGMHVAGHMHGPWQGMHVAGRMHGPRRGMHVAGRMHGPWQGMHVAGRMHGPWQGMHVVRRMHNPYQGMHVGQAHVCTDLNCTASVPWRNSSLYTEATPGCSAV
jgi:hypothetical protein